MSVQRLKDKDIEQELLIVDEETRSLSACSDSENRNPQCFSPITLADLDIASRTNTNRVERSSHDNWTLCSDNNASVNGENQRTDENLNRYMFPCEDFLKSDDSIQDPNWIPTPEKKSKSNINTEQLLQLQDEDERLGSQDIQLYLDTENMENTSTLQIQEMSSTNQKQLQDFEEQDDQPQSEIAYREDTESPSLLAHHYNEHANENIFAPQDVIEHSERREIIVAESGQSIEHNDLSFNDLKRALKKARALGKPYRGFKNLHGKLQLCTEKSARTLKPRCLHTNTLMKSKDTFLCARIPDEERENIHKQFWNIQTWEEKKGFVCASAKRRCIKRRRKGQNNLTKMSGHNFFLNNTKVCKLFFLNTLSLGEDSLRRWTKDSGYDSNDNEPTNSTSSRGSGSLPVCSQLINNIKTWLNILPKVPSHYCRSSSNKMYVESTFRSELHMHQLFKEWCQLYGHKSASRMTFKKVLRIENISIHHPRKDQCDTCCSYKTGNIEKKEYDEHIVKKNEAREAKKEAISSATDTVHVITVDVQSVLLAPKLLASAVYYKQKLQCHNFTIYDTKNKDVTIYFWHEADGNVTANEFTSCMVDYIQALPDSTEKIIVISDGCTNQNRNKVLTSALSDLAQRKNMTIEQLYLEKGHTMMEVDSVHSTIEKYIKPPIMAPSDYIARMHQARPQKPYTIKSIHFDFFRNYENVDTNLKSIRPGKKKGDPVVVDIRGLKYSPDGSIFYKLRHPDSWKTLPQCRGRSNRHRGSEGTLVPRQLYTEPIKISESKYKHLQDLKSVIDRDYHPFYDTLTFVPGT